MLENPRLYIHALLHLARVDGELDEAELLMAHAFAKVHGLSDDLVSDCLENLPSVAATLSALEKLPKADSTRFFWNAVDMVLLDQEMTMEEAMLLGLYGAAAGLKPGIWDLKDDGEHLLPIPSIKRGSA